MGKLLHRNTSYTHGFTIVELVVVIVIIAILATLTLVSYNSVRVRSNNTRTMANVKQYYNAIKLYNIKNGRYPAAPGEGGAQVTMVCLGTGYPSGQCGTITGTTVKESAAFMSDLQSGSGTNIADIVNDQYGVVSSESFIGAAYGIDTTDTAHSPTGRARMIEWYLAGKNQDCQIPQSWAYNSSNGNTACELDFEPF